MSKYAEAIKKWSNKKVVSSAGRPPLDIFKEGLGMMLSDNEETPVDPNSEIGEIIERATSCEELYLNISKFVDDESLISNLVLWLDNGGFNT